MWIYIIGPILGCLLASLFHWNTVSYRRKMKNDKEIENKRLKHQKLKSKTSDDENSDEISNSSNESIEKDLGDRG